MASETTHIEDALAALQRRVRQPFPEGTQAVRQYAIPPDLVAGSVQGLSLCQPEVEALEAATATLAAELAFEHIRDVEKALVRFISQCSLDSDTDFVPGFMVDHYRDVEYLTCFIPVEYLKVEKPTDALGVRFLPHDDSAVPDLGLPVAPQSPVGCVIAVPVAGTNDGLMAERARERASHVLRIMRVSFRQHRTIHDKQLRFRLGMHYAFDDRLSGWRERDDVAYEAPLGEELIKVAQDQPIWSMPAKPSSNAEGKADVALRWMERACMNGEPLIALLFLFFALEALLGDKGERLKAHGLAFRQAMLGHVVEGTFSHPDAAWYLYDKVRSYAVHGESTPDVDWDVVQRFSRDVRRTLNHFLTVVEQRSLARKSGVVRFLDTHEDCSQLTEWLRVNGGDDWTKFLDEREGKDGT